MLLKKIAQQIGKGSDTGEHPRDQADQEGTVYSPPGTAQLTPQQPQQLLRRTGTHRLEQALVHPDYQCDGATGDPRYHIGGTHGHALEIDQHIVEETVIQVCIAPDKRGTNRTGSTC